MILSGVLSWFFLVPIAASSNMFYPDPVGPANIMVNDAGKGSGWGVGDDSGGGGVEDGCK